MNKTLRIVLLGALVSSGCVGNIEDVEGAGIGDALFEAQPKDDDTGAAAEALRSRPSACGSLDYLGRCAGNVSEWCERGAIRRRDCSASGLTCGYIDNRIGYYCEAKQSTPDAGTPRPDASVPDASVPDASVVVVPDASVPMPSGCGTDVERQNLVLTNQARAEAGLSPLVCDEALTRAARLHSQDMCDQGYFSHESQDGRKFTDRIRAQGASFGYAGENIAWGYGTPQAVHDGWMNSSGHKANILGTHYRRVGIGQVSCNGRPYWTQDFTD